MMMPLLSPFVFRTFPVAALLALFVSPAASSGEYERTDNLQAADLFPDLQLESELYRVRDEVSTDGFLTRTLIDSDYGIFDAVGPGMLKIRLKEIEAIARLEVLEDTEEFQRGAKESAEEKKNALEQIMDNPEGALDGIGDGVSRFFKRTVRSAKTGIQKATDAYNEQTPGVVEGGGGEDLPGAAPKPLETEGESRYARAARVSGRVAVSLLGFDDVRRKLAKRLEIDPYSTNAVLNEKLDDVAMTLFAGDLAVDIATSLIPGSVLISTSSVVSDWVWDTSPGDLRVEIERLLLEREIPQEDIDSLLRHQWYPLSLQAILARSLEVLDGAEGLPDIMPLVLSVTYFDQARFVVATLAMLAAYHREMTPLVAVEVAGTVTGRDESGRIVVVGPTDHVAWSEDLDTFTARYELDGEPRHIHIEGTLTAMARENLEARGWEVFTDSELFPRFGEGAE